MSNEEYLQSLIQRSGELIGTDPEYRNIGCIAVALYMLEKRLNEDEKK